MAALVKEAPEWCITFLSHISDYSPSVFLQMKKTGPLVIWKALYGIFAIGFEAEVGGRPSLEGGNVDIAA